MRHHGEALRALTKDDALIEALKRDPSATPLDRRRRALVDYALKLTASPDALTEDDITPMRETGLSDAAIHDAAAVVSYYAFVNRMALGLGVELEEDSGDSR